CLQSKDFPYSF
nr:immunoglobulin light chain junction region [Macaca mulatta]MOY10432.1 immunoglobulin light chain junction region [Macaca mulatta]MOY10443.1 immunoglobulin light chain junction region [Macaca mulatta]MOY10490.1 immunoglobulin light chain junction region [Macaca mulatta]MOY10510.1 immunoglobulin light chain junction region [Macaca mulatta]